MAVHCLPGDSRLFRISLLKSVYLTVSLNLPSSAHQNHVDNRLNSLKQELIFINLILFGKKICRMRHYSPTQIVLWISFKLLLKIPFFNLENNLKEKHSLHKVLLQCKWGDQCTCGHILSQCWLIPER